MSDTLRLQRALQRRTEAQPSAGPFASGGSQTAGRNVAIFDRTEFDDCEFVGPWFATFDTSVFDASWFGPKPAHDDTAHFDLCYFDRGFVFG